MSVVGLICPVLALIATATRLGERVRTRKWGWDDTWAAICLATLIMFVFALFTFFGDIGDPTRLHGPLGVAIFYMVSTTFLKSLQPQAMSTKQSAPLIPFWRNSRTFIACSRVLCCYLVCKAEHNRIYHSYNASWSATETI